MIATYETFLLLLLHYAQYLSFSGLYGLTAVQTQTMDCSLSIKHCPDVLSDKAQVIFGLSLCYCVTEANHPVLQATITHTETKCAVFTGTDDILPLRLSSFTGHGDKGITCQEEPNRQNSNKCEIKSMLWVLEHHIYLHLFSFK